MVAELRAITTVKPPAVQDDDTLVLPAEVPELLGITDAGNILLFESDQGVLVTTRRRYVSWLLDRLGEGIPEEVTLDDLIESGRELREELILEHYGLRPHGTERGVGDVR